jgi:DNA-binding NarL/FixJ family response regulator
MRIVLADNRSRVRFALGALLEEQPWLRIVGEAASGRNLLVQVRAACPDLVLLSWELPGLAEMDLLPALRRSCPELRVIVLSAQPEAQQTALAAGADAFVSKVAPPEQLLVAISAARRAEPEAEAPFSRLKSEEEDDVEKV